MAIKLKVVSKNTRAIYAYEKMGFTKQESYIENNIEWIKMVLYKHQVVSEAAK